MNQDNEHLKLLTIFHYVAAGMIALFACIPLIHFFLGLAFATGAIGGNDDGASVVGLVMVFIAGLIIFCGWALALLVFLSGRNMARRTNYTFSLIMACVVCIFMPVGTVLGVFTIIVLNRESVKALYGHPAASSGGA
jgi:hypothetical protein